MLDLVRSDLWKVGVGPEPKAHALTCLSVNSQLDLHIIAWFPSDTWNGSIELVQPPRLTTPRWVNDGFILVDSLLPQNKMILSTS